MSGPHFDDALFERVSVLTHLERLTLEGTSVTKSGLTTLKSLPSLKFLTIIGPPKFEVEELMSVVADIPSLHHVTNVNWTAARQKSERIAAATKVKWIWGPLPGPLVP
jgi:hypothetical protein